MKWEIRHMNAVITKTRLWATTFLCVAVSGLSGCQSYGPTDLTPASEVLNAACCKPDTTTQINFLTLRQSPPQQYILGRGDTLGIYIQGITGDKDVPPPVHFPEDAGQQPALGYPVPIRDDGYISLPLIKPLRIAGMTLADAEKEIVDAYSEEEILLEGSEKIIVTLMKRRTYNILVIREDLTTAAGARNSIRDNETFIDDSMQTQSFSIELPAYENDVLHALSETGGMPGERALNELLVLRGGLNNFTNVNAIVQEVGGPMGGNSNGTTIDDANVIRIPIEAERNEFPNIDEADITLQDGDIVYIKGRERDVFYTGGLLDGGRFPLPRDYDIDVLEAMALAGGNGSATAGGGSSSSFSGIGSILPATQVTVLRKCGCEQVAIDVDLRYALSDPTERVIIQPGDLIILEYRKPELITNSVLSVFQFGGIFQLFR
ncbi:polysaccharide biosynthesis/export family protein [Mariniblastus fucicola]|uniref:Polysaccharide biosynthesis/export protein n=1 Tax=Mariniblastus fucicola TaxID=980251 RepID=A0A5B9PE29_9BACT|nr:polysaccharide biosynthesis/export family protein [Mariniblastus fucicola]QEG22826.1 Polysaccharide biosynthesis/export protein [Mariniblastus fucicola]